MTEIEKLYNNAGIEGEWRDYRVKNGKIYEGKNPKNRNIRLCKPKFTAEKQIELIKCLANYERFCCWKFKPTNEWVIYDDTYMVDGRDIANSDFEECLASYVNCLWQDLTEQEQQQIKEILQ